MSPLSLRNTLFFKIYLTLLASVLVVAVVGAGLIVLGHGDGMRGGGPLGGILASSVPGPDDQAGTQATLDRITRKMGGDLALFDAEGRLVAAAGEQIDFPGPGQEPSRGRDIGRLVLPLTDGRVLVARLGDGFGPDPFVPLLVLAAVAVVAGLVAWVIVGQLTRRLSRLSDGMQAWGDGDLARRVAVLGRDEIASVAESFNRAAEQHEKLVGAHKTLLANASHELRSPLARLAMAIHIYQDRPREDLRREMDRNLMELDELVGEILLASRLEHLESPAQMQRVDLFAMLEQEARLHGATVSGDRAEIDGDPRLLSRLVRNLLENAVRHGAPPVAATLRRTDRAVELRVRDNGRGIGDSGDRIFEPFYRPPDRGDATGGWGLGLSLVRQIAGHHGATVRHERPKGGGACFVVAFPVDPKRADPALGRIIRGTGKATSQQL